MNKTNWETPACELEQLKADILKKMNDNRISISTYYMMSLKYDRIHHLTFKETKDPDYIILNVFGEKMGSIKKTGTFGKKKMCNLWLYHEKVGWMSMEKAEQKCNDLGLFIEVVKNDNL